jgi:hypothetical protein
VRGGCDRVTTVTLSNTLFLLFGLPSFLSYMFSLKVKLFWSPSSDIIGFLNILRGELSYDTFYGFGISERLFFETGS